MFSRPKAIRVNIRVLKDLAQDVKSTGVNEMTSGKTSLLCDEGHVTT